MSINYNYNDNFLYGFYFSNIEHSVWDNKWKDYIYIYMKGTSFSSHKKMEFSAQTVRSTSQWLNRHYFESNVL